jgi:hypothetical protein
MKTVYPDSYTEEDKGMYDDMILKGQSLIGNKINKNDAFLIDLASKMTINQIKGISSSLSKEEIEETRQLHKNAMNTPYHETPVDIFDKMEHPLSKPADDFYEENMTKPIDDIVSQCNIQEF